MRNQPGEHPELVDALIFHIVVPMLWVSGSLYQVNKHLDDSAITWHATELLMTHIDPDEWTTYHLGVSPWDESLSELVWIEVRRTQFEAFETGMQVRVGVRDGALMIPWVVAVEAAPGSSASLR